ncbi:3-[(3aS,4S,7aS)-7a-methyl-1,5-dioxo-octahydro-1H-inden-4-yl]propanoyl:CoA ligase [Vanrija pseudolonga]|uniref:3-[(3aS,4S,7aS)-7a-methyl-1, 5-dioxo-octahydro-1H-inden-4-yl]propanoyl:CoA ligase n=1 Tax=Vanrija pseudolonga TaxID=143232 RepID=A0AAF0YA32_9TREE|nr:3-[(3aS,4S,7aS)-7a-methyl-1,5-dioxo-octahydro-1H-inden-4-yl]propanoyl:CoA ligase [Vanrija pseudolonga]
MDTQTDTQLSIAECDQLLTTTPGSRWEVTTAIIDGREQRVWKNQPPHFRAFLLAQLDRFADRDLVSSPEGKSRETSTYGDVHARAVSLAAWLRGRGLRASSRVAIGGLNSTEWVVAFVAVHLLGAVPVLLNSTLHPGQQAHCLTITKPDLILVDGKLAEQIVPVAKRLSAKGYNIIFAWSSIAHIPASNRAGIQQLTVTATEADVAAIEAGEGFDLTPESDGQILFTSGTTSAPKAVLVTQRGALSHILSSNITSARATLRAGGSYADAQARLNPPATQNVMLVPVPLFHVTGCLSWLIKAMTFGSKVVFMRRWDVDTAIDLISSERVNVIGGVPAIATSVVKAADRLPPGHTISSVNYGGAPPPASLAAEIQKAWPGASLANGYGMTETNGIITCLSGADYIANPKSVGVPFPLTQVRIVHPDTREPLPANEVGLILVKGSNVMKGYLGDAAATQKAMQDGWFDTGDLGSMTAEGWLSIGDRQKDMIIRGGENIASAEVEHALCEDLRVEHAAAVPVPDDVLGERVGVAVTLAPGATATPGDILASAEPRLRHAARPAVVVILPTLPRNASGKVVKTDVKKVVGRVWANAAPVSAPSSNSSATPAPMYAKAKL